MAVDFIFSIISLGQHIDIAFALNGTLATIHETEKKERRGEIIGLAEMRHYQATPGYRRCRRNQSPVSISGPTRCNEKELQAVANLLARLALPRLVFSTLAISSQVHLHG